MPPALLSHQQQQCPKNCDGKPEVADKTQICLDILSIKQKKGQPKAPKLNWRIMVDECTQLKFFGLCTVKDEMVEPACKQFKKWEQVGKKVDVV